MNIRAKNDGEVLVFELEGHLDFETMQEFHNTCSQIATTKGPKRIVFNMEKLKFVGSSGISSFIKAIKDLNSKRDKPKLCNLSSEFEKMFRAYQTTRHPFEIYETELEAKQSFDAPPTKRTRKKRIDH